MNLHRGDPISMARLMSRLAVAFLLAGTSPFASAGVPAMPESARVTLVVPYPQGGAADLAARAIIDRWSARLGEPMGVENHPGADGIVGTDKVAKARPDGRTLGLGSLSPLALTPGLNRPMPFDPNNDLVAVGTVATTTQVLLVNPSLKADSLRELLAHAKARPGQLSLGVGGLGAAVLVQRSLPRELLEPSVMTVRYRGDGPALAELVAGQIEAAIVTVPAALPYLRTGRLRALATLGAERSTALPGVPAISDYDGRPAPLSWLVVIAPAGTPAGTIMRLNRALDEALRDPDLGDRLGHQGFDPWVSSPEAAGAFVRGELDRWTRLLRDRSPPVERGGQLNFDLNKYKQGKPT